MILSHGVINILYQNVWKSRRIYQVEITSNKKSKLKYSFYQKNWPSHWDGASNILRKRMALLKLINPSMAHFKTITDL